MIGHDTLDRFLEGVWAALLVAVLTVAAAWTVVRLLRGRRRKDPFCLALLLPVLLPFAAAGQSLTLPAEIKVPAPGLVLITPTAVDADAVAYTAVDDGLQFIPAALLKDSTTAVGVVVNPGRYRVRAVAAKTVKDKGAVLSPFYETVLVVGGTPPTPPIPPAPADPLTAALQAGYATDADADRAASLLFLQNVYAGMAASAPAWGAKTTADAFAKIQSVVHAPGVGLTQTQVVNLRKALAAELAAKLGTVPAQPLDPAALAAELGKIAAALKGVK